MTIPDAEGLPSPTPAVTNVLSAGDSQCVGAGALPGPCAAAETADLPWQTTCKGSGSIFPCQGKHRGLAGSACPWRSVLTQGLHFAFKDIIFHWDLGNNI